MSGRRKGMKHRVAGYLREHPDASASDIAQALDCCVGYVNATVRRDSLPIVRGKRRPRAAANHWRNVRLSKKDRDIFRPDAQSRGITVEELSEQLLHVVAQDRMVGAILDDGAAK